MLGVFLCFNPFLLNGGRLEQGDLTASDKDKRYLHNFLTKYVNSLKGTIKNRFPGLPLLSAFHNFLTKYVNSLKGTIKNRFPGLPLLSAFSIFDPSQFPERGQPGFAEYGNAAVTLLAEQYLDDQRDKKQLMDEWQVFKYDLVKWKKDLPEEVRKPPGRTGSNPTITPTDWCFQKLLFMKDLVPFNLPLVAKVAEAVIALPVSNVWPERGASSLKLMKTRLCSRMKNDVLNSLLHILINGPEVGSKKFEVVVDSSVATGTWLAAKPRRKCPPKFVSTSVVASSVSSVMNENAAAATVVDAGVQTCEPSIAEEVNETSKALELPDSYGDDSDYGSDFE